MAIETILLILLVITMLGTGGYALASAILEYTEPQQEEIIDGRFLATYKQNIGGINELIVVCDTETNSEYLFFYGYKAGGLTPLGTSCQD